jgi:hypothetical protein
MILCIICVHTYMTRSWLNFVVRWAANVKVMNTCNAQSPEYTKGKDRTCFFYCNSEASWHELQVTSKTVCVQSACRRPWVAFNLTYGSWKTFNLEYDCLVNYVCNSTGSNIIIVEAFLTFTAQEIRIEYFFPLIGAKSKPNFSLKRRTGICNRPLKTFGRVSLFDKMDDVLSLEQ